MKENFVIREERHPIAKSIYEIAKKVSKWGGGLMGPLFLFTLITGNGTGITIATLLFIVVAPCLIIEVVSELLIKENLTCGFNVNGLQVKGEIQFDMDGSPKFREFIVNGEVINYRYGKFPRDAVHPDTNQKDGLYAKTNVLENHVLTIFEDGEVGYPDCYILLDGVIIVEHGMVYVDKIHEILSGSPASANQPLPVDTGVMPAFQTTPSHSNAESTVAPRTKHYAIVGQAGVFENKRFDVASTLVLGRDAVECGLVFPTDTAGVSRVHCKLVVEADGLWVYDLGSTYGTAVNNNKTISANQMMKLNHGDTITIGSNQTFVVLYS